jgi:NAD(P)-dependent dehydrogenase (short-subunit alcohol dehydrogenase family)
MSSSQVYLITGANGGLGLDSVSKLAILPATDGLPRLCSEDKANAAIEQWSPPATSTKTTSVRSL